MLKHPSIVVALAAVVVAATACMEPSDPLPRGHELYQSCQPCHGADAGGNPAILAPSIAGLPEWYIEAQLMKFRSAKRGYHFDDIAGLRMRPMALSMPTTDDVKTVAAYIAQLPRVTHPPMVEGGDANKGKALFATCVACHGPDAAGNKAMNAPPIAGADDWYLLEQLGKFKKKIRGDGTIDQVGATMQAMSLSLPDEQAMKDVVAYIKTLPPPKPEAPAPNPTPEAGKASREGE
jgi:cytochrome c553